MLSTSERDKIMSRVEISTKPAIVKIKQRNTVEGVSKICGLEMLSSNGETIVSIDLCPGLGKWRIQHLGPSEFIIGFHTYIPGDDESVALITPSYDSQDQDGQD